MTRVLSAIVLLLLGVPPLCAQARGRGVWSKERARDWADSTGWLVGANFVPSTAINQLEMWQAATFDTATIARELGWAQFAGFNTMRVFLHHLLWEQDSTGFLRRIDTFLAIADRHRIRPMFVLFDAVWDPMPRLGRQRPPIPHIHNSGWVQSPGVAILSDTARFESLRGYVQGVVGRFARDRRVVAWDIFNEPDNDNRPAYVAYEPLDKAARSFLLLRKAFAWARAVNPSQPLTAAPWKGDWVDPARMLPITAYMLDSSDVISFHSYDDSTNVDRLLNALERYGRPIICTEYMARPRGSTFQKILPILARRRIGAYNWGFVSGKTQTIYPWDSWHRTYSAEPTPWFHDVFRRDGTPYDSAEVTLIRALTAAAPPADTIHVEVGSPAVDGRVYAPHAARVRVYVGPGAGRMRAEWTNVLTVGDSAGRSVHRWVTAGTQMTPAGDTVKWELRQTYDARTLAPYGIARTSSTGATSSLRIDGRRVRGTRRANRDVPEEQVAYEIERPGFVASASDLVPLAVGFRPGRVIVAPVWGPAMQSASEMRLFSVIGRTDVDVEGTRMNAWKVEERRQSDGKLVATWFLVEKSPYMVYGEVPLPDGSVQRMTEVEMPIPPA